MCNCYKVSTSQTAAISVTDLTKRYGERNAVDHISFEVPRGTICGFVGPNGAGKTTTIRMLLGLVKPTAGVGTVLGEPLTHPERFLGKVGALIEGPAFYPALSGRENLKVLATLGNFPHDRVDQLLDQVGLLDRGSSKFKTYSLGMKQRLGIAAALLPSPELLILDEPTNGLDPAGIQEVRELLGDLAGYGLTVLVSSHLLLEIEAISDDLVMLRDGKVLFWGQTKALLTAQQPTVIASTTNPQDLARLVEIATNSGHQAKIVNEAVHIVADITFAASFNKNAFAAGIVLSSLVTARPTLEETFFELTSDN